MDGQQFDALARAWAAHSRRWLMQSLGVSALAGLAGWESLEDLAARRGRKNARRKRRRDRDDDVEASGGKKRKGKGKGKKKKKKGESGTPGGGSPETGSCPKGEKRCIDVCVKLAFDPLHCGQCGVVCPESHPRCEWGVCSVASTCQSEFACAGQNCGEAMDQCGNLVNCGTCTDGEQCGPDNVCRCPTECCRNSACDSGLCFQGSCCLSDAQECNNAGGRVCGSLPTPICGRTVQCGTCQAGKICHQGQCRPPCPSGEFPCGDTCVRGVCCSDDDCPGANPCVTSEEGERTCCVPDPRDSTCFPTQGEPFCGFVNNNCGRGVDCGGCTLSNDICAADNHCRPCGADHQAVNGECCPADRVCSSGQSGQVCCQPQNGNLAGQQRICCGNGQGCAAPLGGGCRNPGTSDDCCSGTCVVTGSDEFGPYGRCQ